MDYKAEALELVDEVLLAYNAQEILLRLILDVSPSRTLELAGKDLEAQIKKVETKIATARARRLALREA